MTAAARPPIFSRSPRDAPGSRLGRSRDAARIKTFVLQSCLYCGDHLRVHPTFPLRRIRLTLSHFTPTKSAVGLPHTAYLALKVSVKGNDGNPLHVFPTQYVSFWQSR